MIKSKKCVIEICNLPAFSKGYCKKHCNFKELKEGNKRIKAKREGFEEKKAEQTEKRNEYFEYHLKRCTHSQHSGLPINEPTRANIAHLVDKGRHKSLEDNLENCIYLTTSEHERWDKLLFSHEFDKLEKEFENTWINILPVYKKLLSLCQENTVFTRALKKYLDGRKSESQ